MFMINVENLNLDNNNLIHFKHTQEGCVAIGRLKTNDLDVGFEVEGCLLGIKGIFKGAFIQHVYKTEDHTESFNEFLGDLYVGTTS